MRSVRSCSSDHLTNSIRMSASGNPTSPVEPRLKLDPFARRYTVRSLSIILLLGSYGYFIWNSLRPITVLVQATGLTGPVSHTITLLGALALPLLILHGFGLLQRSITMDLASLRQRATCPEDHEVHELLRALERRLRRDARAMGIRTNGRGSRLEFRYRERGAGIMTTALGRGHIITIGVGWVRALHEQRGGRAELAPMLRSMLLHELGHITSRDVHLLGLINICLALGIMGLLATCLSWSMPITPWNLAVMSIGTAVLLLLPHQYVARRRESHADAVSLRYQNVLEPLELALNDDLGGNSVAHGHFGVIARRFSRKRPEWPTTRSRIIGTVRSLLDHHFDSRDRLEHLREEIEKEDGLFVHDCFVFGIVAYLVPAVLMILVSAAVLALGSNPDVWKVPVQIVVASPIYFVLFNSVGEHILFSRGVSRRTLHAAIAFGLGTVVPLVLFGAVDVMAGAGSLANANATPLRVFLVGLSIIPTITSHTAIFYCFLRQASIITEVSSIKRSRIGIRWCAALTVIMFSALLWYQYYQLAKSGFFAGQGLHHASMHMGSLAGIAYFLIQRFIVERVVWRLMGRKAHAWECRACGSENELLSPGLLLGRRNVDHSEDVTNRCTHCGTFVHGQLFFEVAEHGATIPKATSRPTPLLEAFPTHATRTPYRDIGSQGRPLTTRHPQREAAKRITSQHIHRHDRLPSPQRPSSSPRVTISMASNLLAFLITLGLGGLTLLGIALVVDQNDGAREDPEVALPYTLPDPEDSWTIDDFVQAKMTISANTLIGREPLPTVDGARHAIFAKITDLDEITRAIESSRYGNDDLLKLVEALGGIFLLYQAHFLVEGSYGQEYVRTSAAYLKVDALRFQMIARSLVHTLGELRKDEEILAAVSSVRHLIAYHFMTTLRSSLDAPEAVDPALVIDALGPILADTSVVLLPEELRTVRDDFRQLLHAAEGEFLMSPTARLLHDLPDALPIVTEFQSEHRDYSRKHGDRIAQSFRKQFRRIVGALRFKGSTPRG